jgi:hypothetical protein
MGFCIQVKTYILLLPEPEQNDQPVTNDCCDCCDEVDEEDHQHPEDRGEREGGPEARDNL